MTKITQNERVVLAAVLGGSNMGQRKPERQEVQKYLLLLNNATYDHKPLDKVASAACSFWGAYMESDEIEKAFVGECKWWYKDKTNWNGGREYIIKTWPDVAKLMDWC